MWSFPLPPPHRLAMHYVYVTVLLGVLLCAAQAHAWPSFLSLSRTSSTAAATSPASTGGGAREALPDRSAVEHPPSPFPGAAERAEQARALWQEVEARGRLSPCWKRSILLLQSTCGDVQRDDVTRSRLALFMATCDADNDGRTHPSFHCGVTAAAAATATPTAERMPAEGVRACVRGLADSAYAAFVQYRLHADVLCAYLQEELYQERTEAAVAAMVHEMESSAAVLAALRDSGAEMFALARDTQALQRDAESATAGLRRQLDLLQHGHASTLVALRTAADDILDSSTRTDAALTQLHAHVQAAAADALASVEALSRQSLLQFAAVEEQTRGVVHLIGQVDRVQRLLTRQSLSWQQLLFTAACIVVVWAATSVPRTAAARLPAAAVTLFGTVGGPLLLHQLAGHPGNHLLAFLLRTRLWQSACAASVVCFVAGAAYHHTSPETLQRRMAREEARRVWCERHTQPTTTAAVAATTALQPYVPHRAAVLSSLQWRHDLLPTTPALMPAAAAVRPVRDIALPFQHGGDVRHLSLVASPLDSDDDDDVAGRDAAADALPGAVQPATPPHGGVPAVVAAADTPDTPQRKRGRPPGVTCAADPGSEDGGIALSQATKAPRVETPPKAAKVGPAKPRGGRRPIAKSPKKKG